MSDDAFTQLVDMYYPSLYRFALSLARSEADACDLAQQTFYVWAKKGHALREAAKAKSWLFTTLYREFLRGRRRGERMTALDTVPESQLEEVTLEPEIVASMDGGVVMTALQEVEEIFRAPLTLFYLEELSYQEIAETLEVPVGTVMSRLSRGKTQLRARLASRIGTKSGTVVPFQNSNNKASHG
ncbi:MAG: RNA polymerase sigma factor [Nibricoccus sp.]